MNLKPCPFCGGESELLASNYITGSPDYRIVCNNCSATTARKSFIDESSSIWNSRPLEDKMQAAIDEACRWIEGNLSTGAKEIQALFDLRSKKN